MSRLNFLGYVERRTSKNNVWRDWYLVKHSNTKTKGSLSIGTLTIPKEYIGKKIRFKIEVLDD